MAGLPGLPPPGFSEAKGLPGLPPPGFATDGNAVSAQLGKGLTFGFFDELQGLEAGAQNSLRNLFGSGNEKGFWDNYDEKVKDLRATDKAFEAEHPYASAGLQIAGGIAPMIATAGQSAAPAMAPVMSNLFGVGIKGAPSVFKLAKMGATGGAAYGAGEANDGNRLWGATKGGLIGAIAAPVVGTALKGGIEIVGDAAANRNLFRRLGSEAGSVFSGEAPPKAYSAAEKMLAKELKNTPVDKVKAGLGELEEAVAGDVPLFLPEAVGSPKVDRNARFVANYDPSLEFSQTAIANRTSEAPARAVGLFSRVSPEGNSFEGAMSMANAAGDIAEQADKARIDGVKKFYTEAYDKVPSIESDEFADFLSNDKVLQRAINDVKKTAENARFPDNSSQILVKARQEIFDRIESAKKLGNNREARDLQTTYNTLNDFLHGENPALVTADLEYQRLSTGVDEMTNSFLSRLKNFSADKIQNVGQIFQLPAERITALRATFEKAGKLSEWNAGIRAHLQNSVEGTHDGRNFTDKIIGNTLQKAKLKAALGDAYTSVEKGLSLENRMFEGRNKYHAGSSTAGNLAERGEFEKGVGILRRLMDKDISGAVSMLFKGDMPDEIAQELSKIYFNPQRGSESLGRIIPLLEQYAKNRQVAGAVSKGTGAAASRVDSVSPESLLGLHQQTSGTGAKRPVMPLSEESTAASSSLGAAKKESQIPDSSSDFTSGKPTTQGEYEPTSYRNPLFSPRKSMDAGKPPIQLIEAEIDKDPYYSALYEAESGRNPKAKNPESTAKGGFQFLNGTAKLVGLKDPFDLSESFEKVKFLTSDHQQKFGDNPATLYAAHYLGAPVLNKVLTQKPLTEEEQAQVSFFRSPDGPLARFMAIYGRIAGKKGGSIEV